MKKVLVVAFYSGRRWTCSWVRVLAKILAGSWVVGSSSLPLASSTPQPTSSRKPVESQLQAHRSTETKLSNDVQRGILLIF